MSILEVKPDLLDALRGDMTEKFLATRSATGVPNVVPVTSIQPADDQPDTLFFGNFWLRKTIQNLQEDARLAVLVVTPGLTGWVLKGDFVEFQRAGAYVDRQMSSSPLRYNAYTGIRNAGILRIQSVERQFALSKMQVMREYGLARLAGLVRPRTAASPTVPRAVRREFARMVAVKVLAWIREDGYPTIVPAFSLQPAGDQAMVCWNSEAAFEHLAAEAIVAANILTFEAVSYQAKGRWAGGRRAGRIEVSEVYAGGPPIPGGRVA